MKKLFAIISSCWLIMILFWPTQGLAEDKKKTFSQAELEQMMAPIALYPDSLLSQILMASTYPDDVQKAVKWSKSHPDEKGDNAVKAVQKKNWAPSVMSLVAFPQVLEMMGEKPKWVVQVGDAFLAEPDKVMDTVQSLRHKAKKAGYLKNNKEQKITETSSGGQSVIIIEPANPAIVYVPVYNPVVVYGPWLWPAYAPYYYYPPGYRYGAAAFGFGVGVGVTYALWGNVNWAHSTVNINVHTYNNININHINSNHVYVNSIHTNNVNINNVNVNNIKRNNINTNNFNKNDINSNNFNKNDFNSNNFNKSLTSSQNRDAERQRAQQSLTNRGINPSTERQNLFGSGGESMRNQLSGSNRSQGLGGMENRGNWNRFTSQSGHNSLQNFNGDHALSGIRNSEGTFRSFDRGTFSNRSMGSGGGGGGFRGRR